MNSVFEKIKIFLPKLSLSVIVFFIFFCIATIYKKSIKIKTNEKLIDYDIKMIFYYIILLIGIFCSIIPLGIQTGTLFALFGSVGLAIALSLQGVLTNIVSGIYISVNNMFEIGSEIKIIDTSGMNPYKGKVINFNLFNTIIRIDDDTEATIPNTYIQNNIIQNFKPKQNSIL